MLSLPGRARAKAAGAGGRDDAARRQYTKQGRLIREFDPLLFDQPWIGRPLPQERGIRFGDEKDANPMAQSMLLAYRLTGIALIEDALTPRKGWLGAAVRL